MSVVVALVVALAVLAASGPRGRRAGPLARPRVRGSMRSGTATAWSRIGRRGLRPGGSRDLAVVVIEVASQLRAGADPGRAWARALGVPVGSDGIPDLDDLVGEGTRAQAA
ncbi:MAG TPA: hypothetical protein VIK12_03790, partial [Pengzhenrongella sp.]